MKPAKTQIRPCPECEAGKHLNCDGTAWDDDLDCEARCPCADVGHGPRR